MNTNWKSTNWKSINWKSLGIAFTGTAVVTTALFLLALPNSGFQASSAEPAAGVVAIEAELPAAIESEGPGETQLAPAQAALVRTRSAANSASIQSPVANPAPNVVRIDSVPAADKIVVKNDRPSRGPREGYDPRPPVTTTPPTTTPPTTPTTTPVPPVNPVPPVTPPLPPRPPVRPTVAPLPPFIPGGPIIRDHRTTTTTTPRGSGETCVRSIFGGPRICF